MSPEMFDGTDAEDETWLNREGSWGEIPDDSFWAKLDGPYEKYRQTGQMSRENLDKRMAYHRETYVTLEDFRYLQAHGITHVRIPVPYFIFGDREPYVGCVEYLDRAFGWFFNALTIILMPLTFPASPMIRTMLRPNETPDMTSSISLSHAGRVCDSRLHKVNTQIDIVRMYNMICQSLTCMMVYLLIVVLPAGWLHGSSGNGFLFPLGGLF